MSDHERFWSKVNKTDGCWIWTAADDGKGYGSFGELRDGRFITTKAHRLSYAWATGEDITGLDILHLCDNPACVRPDHLRAGTAADNMADMHRKGRQAAIFGTSTHCVNGHEKIPENRFMKGKYNSCHVCQQESRARRSIREKEARKVRRNDD